MTDKIKAEDFIKAFGSGVSAKVENVPMKLEVSMPIVIDCKYYLPCGRCDKTGGFCSQLNGIGAQPTSFVLPTEYTTSTSAREVKKNETRTLETKNNTTAKI